MGNCVVLRSDRDLTTTSLWITVMTRSRHPATNGMLPFVRFPGNRYIFVSCWRAAVRISCFGNYVVLRIDVSAYEAGTRQPVRYAAVRPLHSTARHCTALHYDGTIIPYLLLGLPQGTALHHSHTLSPPPGHGRFALFPHTDTYGQTTCVVAWVSTKHSSFCGGSSVRPSVRPRGDFLHSSRLAHDQRPTAGLVSVGSSPTIAARPHTRPASHTHTHTHTHTRTNERKKERTNEQTR